MFFRKVTCRKKGKDYTYVKLIENYRDGDKVKQRVIANFGSIENLTPGKVQGLISGLARICGIPQASPMEAQKTLRYGEVLAIHRVWEILDLDDALEQALPGPKTGINVPLLLKLMVMSQVIEPQNRQALNDWCEYLYLPGLDEKKIPPHHYYKALDLIAGAREELEARIFEKLAATIKVNAATSFCLLTTSTVEPVPSQDLNLTSYGRYVLEEAEKNKKVDLLVAITREGVPFAHRILQELPEAGEFEDMARYLRNRYGVKRCIFVGRGRAERNRLSVALAHGHEYITGRKASFNRDRSLLKELAPGRTSFEPAGNNLYFKETRSGRVRRLFCLDSQAAGEIVNSLDERLRTIENELKKVREAAGNSAKPSFNKSAPVFQDSYTRRFFQWRYERSNGEFSYHLDKERVEQEKELAGLYIVETNASLMSGREVLSSYTEMTSLAESFAEIKSFLEKPSLLYDHLNLSSNIFVSVLATALEKVLERIVKEAGISLSSRQALELLASIKVAVSLTDNKEVKSVTRPELIQEQILSAMGIGNLQQTIV